MASPDVGDRFMVPNILLVQPFNSLFFPFIVHVILQTIQKHEPAISLPFCDLVSVDACLHACHKYEGLRCLIYLDLKFPFIMKG